MLPSDDNGLREILLGKNFKKNAFVDRQLAVSNQANTILNSVVQFIPAKRKFEDESTELKSKYIRLRAASEATVMNGHGLKTECSKNPSTSKSPNLFEFHLVKKPGIAAAKIDDGIPPPMVDIFPADAVRVTWDSKFRKSTAIGLHNLGNTCFLNSILQILTNTAPLANYLLNNEHDTGKCPSSTGFCALCLMRNHVQRIFSSSHGSAVAPQAVVSRVRCFMKSYSHGRQEDAHEFLRYFIDSMQTAALYGFKGKKLDLYTKETSVIGRIFGGYHKNEVMCNKCQFSSTTYDPFLDLSVEVKQSQTLEAALSHFTRPEMLAHENAYKCPRCKIRVSARKLFTIHQAPNILTIQLKRFDHMGKIDRYIAYPERLNLRPYMTEKQGPPVHYKLFGVVVHHGRSTRSGHYYAYIRNPCDQWHVLDDSRAASVSANNALKSSGAYLLFYVRIPTPTAAVKPQMHSSVISQSRLISNGNGMEVERHTPIMRHDDRRPISVSPQKIIVSPVSKAIVTPTKVPPSPRSEPKSPITPISKSISPSAKPTPIQATKSIEKSTPTLIQSRLPFTPIPRSPKSGIEKANASQSSPNLSAAESMPRPIAVSPPKTNLTPEASDGFGDGVKSKLRRAKALLKEERRKRKELRQEKKLKRMREKNEKIEARRRKEEEAMAGQTKLNVILLGKEKNSGQNGEENGMDEIENGPVAFEKNLLTNGDAKSDVEGNGSQESVLDLEGKKKKKRKKLKKSVQDEALTNGGVDDDGEERRRKRKKERKEKKLKKRRLILFSGEDEKTNGHVAQEDANVVEQLEKQHGFGYGCSVKSWGGSVNVVDQFQDEADDVDQHGDMEDWNEEYDRGKQKKRKRKRGQFMLMGVNPFQSAQNSKNRGHQVFRNIGTV